MGWHARRRCLVQELVGDHVLRVGVVGEDGVLGHVAAQQAAVARGCVLLLPLSLLPFLSSHLLPLDVHGVDELVGLRHRVVGRADVAMCSQSLGWQAPSATQIARASSESTTCTARGRVMRAVSTSIGSPGTSALPMASTNRAKAESSDDSKGFRSAKEFPP